VGAAARHKQGSRARGKVSSGVLTTAGGVCRGTAGCKPGYGTLTVDDERCTACPEGTYSPGGSLSPCIQCPGSAFMVTPRRATRVSQCTCKPGARRVHGPRAGSRVARRRHRLPDRQLPPLARTRHCRAPPPPPVMPPQALVRRPTSRTPARCAQSARTKTRSPRLQTFQGCRRRAARASPEASSGPPSCPARPAAPGAWARAATPRRPRGPRPLRTACS
jgi:hypothetical protein